MDELRKEQGTGPRMWTGLWRKRQRLLWYWRECRRSEEAHRLAWCSLIDLAARAFHTLRISSPILPLEEPVVNSAVEPLMEELGLRRTEKKKDDEKREDHVEGAGDDVQEGGMLNGACGFSTEKDMDAGFSQTKLSEPLNSNETLCAR